MNSELECEREVLKEKRKLIKKELEIKNDNLNVRVCENFLEAVSIIKEEN